MITPTINENYKVFTEDFFAPYKSKQTDFTLQLTDQISKTFKFPTLFKGTENGIGIFLCSYDKLKKHITHKNLEPVKMPGGRAILAISCFKYKHIQEMQAYNEISFTVPVVSKSAFNIPFLTLATKDLLPTSSVSYYVISMPVNSEENNIRGNKIWGLPKYTTKIEVSTNESRFRTVLYDNHEPFIELAYPTQGSDKHFSEALRFYTMLNNQTLKAQVNYTGQYKVSTNLSVALGKSNSEHSEYIKIHDTPKGLALKDLEIDPIPFETRYSNNVLSALHLPEVIKI